MPLPLGASSCSQILEVTGGDVILYTGMLCSLGLQQTVDTKSVHNPPSRISTGDRNGTID